MNDLDESLEVIMAFLVAITALLILLTWLEATLDPDRDRSARAERRVRRRQRAARPNATEGTAEPPQL